jgi:hypothetical protein
MACSRVNITFLSKYLNRKNAKFIYSYVKNYKQKWEILDCQGNNYEYDIVTRTGYR